MSLPVITSELPVRSSAQQQQQILGAPAPLFDPETDAAIDQFLLGGSGGAGGSLPAVGSLPSSGTFPHPQQQLQLQASLRGSSSGIGSSGLGRQQQQQGVQVQGVASGGIVGSGSGALRSWPNSGGGSTRKRDRDAQVLQPGMALNLGRWHGGSHGDARRRHSNGCRELQ